MPWVLVGVPNGPKSVKAIGPFDDADEAREAANRFGVGDMIAWRVIPLHDPEEL